MLPRRRSSLVPSSHRRPISRSARPRLELLEDRLVPALAILGPAVVAEGQTFTLALDAGGRNLDHWTIDWGDGSAPETLPGAAVQATHVFDDGPAQWDIHVSAVEVSPLALFWWDPAAGGNGHYYALTPTASNWTQAEGAAVQNGGHLVSITNLAEQNFVVSRFLSAPDDRKIYWIGINDQAVEGTFVWSSGEAVSFTNWQPPGEPNNFNGVEDYGSINWHFGQGRPTGVLGSWNDSPLEGVNSALNAPQPYFGILEFSVKPLGPVTALTTQVVVDNVAPQAAISGSDLGLRGETLTFTLTAADPSPADQQSVFHFALDWNGDGQTDEVVVGASGVQVSHVFAAAGAFTVGVTAIDDDGGVGPQTQHPVAIKAALLENGVLRVGGTAQDDTIEVVRDGNNVIVRINDALEGVFAKPQGIVVHGYAGNDRIHVGGFRGWMVLHGDDGDDRLKAGLGDALLLGGDGDDVLMGGRGNDVLVGGAGRDVLRSHGGRDLMLGGLDADRFGTIRPGDLAITGASAFDQDSDAWLAVFAAWTSTGDVAAWLSDQTFLADGAPDKLPGAPVRGQLIAGPDDLSPHPRKK